MNVLLTSVGRRAYMVRYFKEALNGEGKVHVCNSDKFSVAFQYADKSVVSPLIYDSVYIPFLLEYCRENCIDILLSLFDIDLLILSMHKAEFEKIGVNVIVSNQEFIKVCNDKWQTFQFLRNLDIATPKVYLTLQEAQHALESAEIAYPVIVKPRFGCGSIAMSVAEDETDLLQTYKKISKEIFKTYLKYESALEENNVLIQEYLHGQEYGIDIINDLEGNFKNAIVKKKIAMRSGETDISETVDLPEIYSIAEKIGKTSGHIGNVDMDVFMVNDIPYVLEMNARFGGGYPFSQVAGCNLPKAIINWCSGRNVEDSLLQAKAGVLSYKEIILTQQKDN